MPHVGFEPPIRAFEREKTVHALNRVATVIDNTFYSHVKIYYQYSQKRHDTLKQKSTHSIVTYIT
jgi:hypothetical protein